MTDPAPSASGRASLLLGALALVAFAPALVLGSEPIADTPMLLERVRFGSPQAWLAVFGESYWGTLWPGAGGYRPLALLWLGSEAALFGARHGPMLAVGIALHVAGVVLVHRLLLRVLSQPVATGAAAICAVHPIGAEAVITVYGQVDALAALLTCGAIWLHVASLRRGGRALAALTPLVGLAALLVKESAVVAPLLAWIVEGRLRGKAHGIPAWRPSRGVLSMAAAVGAGLAARFLVLGGEALPTTISVSGAETPGARLQLVIVSLGTALRLLVLPWGQTVYYGHLRDSVASGAPLEAAWVAGFVALAGWLRGRAAHAETRFGLAWLAIALLPVASVVPIGFLAAERALYLPRIGFAVAASSLAIGALRRVLADEAARRSAALATAGLVVLLGVGLSWSLARHWRDPVALWRHTCASHPRSPKAHAAYAVALLSAAEAGRRIAPDDPVLAESRRLALRALELHPGSPEGLRALALVSELEKAAERDAAARQESSEASP